MTTDECFRLGRITKPWGYRGQAVVFLDVDSPTDYADLDSAYVETKNGLVPYFFKLDNFNGNKAVATFEDIDPEQAAALVGHDLYLPLSMLPPLTGNQFYFHEVVGFAVVDDNYGEVGTIKGVLEYVQPLFQIDKNGTEILVPIVDEIVKKVDREHKTIYISAPNGLIELYLDESNKGC
ncbi:MAG: 16S rRNA processing protein RimM [Bacteroidales bacterium]|nr:16S rRNA processing protein RimM [Bacteroidales bacterium]